MSLHGGEYVALVDVDLTIRGVSDSLASLLGYPPAELIGESGWEFVADTPDDPFELDEWLIGIRDDLMHLGIHRRVAVLKCRNGARPRFDATTQTVNGYGLFSVTGEVLPEAGMLLPGTPFLTKHEVAALSRRGLRTVERATATGALRCDLPGRKGVPRLYALAAVQEWIHSGASSVVERLTQLGG